MQFIYEKKDFNQIVDSSDIRVDRTKKMISKPLFIIIKPEDQR